jgi:hypothetical protein
MIFRKPCDFVRKNSYDNLIIMYFTILMANNNKEFRKITAFVAATETGNFIFFSED